jgi:hypothetical protein
MPSKNTRAVVLTPELERLVREAAEEDTVNMSVIVRQSDSHGVLMTGGG